MVLTGVDPATGWLPEDFLLGLLYPNDDTGRGDGYLTYLAQPQVGLPSGTRIENKARIYFDWNDPVDTLLVFNTLDAGVPTSEVAPLSSVTPTTRVSGSRATIAARAQRKANVAR